MIKVEKVSVMNMENAIRGARNPMNSWNRIDSYYDENNDYLLGPQDLDLAIRLCKAGADHRKFLRQIFVSVDITAPLYWWKEYDTYKVGTTANSCSTMHKIHSRALELEDFSIEQLEAYAMYTFKGILSCLNGLREEYIATKNKQYWYSMIQLLPSSYNQMRTCTMTYENLFNMIMSRENHKLDEWRSFVKWALNLPYMKEFLEYECLFNKCN